MSKQKVTLDFKRISSARAVALAGDTLAQGGFDSEGERLRRDARALESGSEVTSNLVQMQKEVTWAGAMQPLFDGIKGRDGHFKGRKIILAIDELHIQIPAQKMKKP